MKTYKLNEINANNIVASEQLAESRLEGQQRFRHVMCRPSPEEEAEAEAEQAKKKFCGFTIELPCMLTSSIFEVLDPISGDRNYHIFADVYARYGEVYQRVSKEIDAMLVDCPPELLYEPLFFVEMNEKRGYNLTLLERCCATVGKRMMDEEFFRHLVLSFLIPVELEKEQDGSQICEAMATLKQVYCDSLDSRENRANKQKIYNAMGLSMEDSVATTEHVDDIVKWHLYQPNHPTMANRIDYSKSPQITIKLLAGRPASSSSKQAVQQQQHLLIPETGQLIYTKIYDATTTTFPNPATTMAELEPFLYRKGEWLSTSKEPFKLLQMIVVNAPSVYWFEGNEKAVIQFRASKSFIYKKAPIPVSDRMLIAREKQLATKELIALKPASIRCTRCGCLVSDKSCATCSGPICFGCPIYVKDRSSCYACASTKEDDDILNQPLLIVVVIFVIATVFGIFHTQ